MSVYPFIEAERVEHRNVTKACALMEVSRSAFYEWVQHQPSRRKVSDAELGKRIVQIHAKSRGTYGAPRVQAQLRRDGVATLLERGLIAHNRHHLFVTAQVFLSFVGVRDLTDLSALADDMESVG